LFQRFYDQVPDQFFQLVFFTNFTQTMSGFANELNIKNDVNGIGLPIFDSSVQYGSNGVLESRCNMNRLNAWLQADPAARWFSKGNNFLTIMGQEAGHRWGAFTLFDAGSGPSNLILGRSNAHWSYYADVDHSSLEGGNWVNIGGNNWQCPTQIDYFSELDEYLFGLRTPDEVTDLFYISSPSNNLSANRSIGTPLINATAGGTQVPVTVDHIIAANGEREPVEASETKDYRQGFIFLLQAGTSPSQDDLNKIAGFRRAWEDYFEKACDGRLTCNTTLSTNYPVAVVCGHVRDENNNQIIPEFTARSLERGFHQHVPRDGRYTFRYQAAAGSGPSEAITMVFEAPNFDPDTLTTTVAYGTTQCQDILMHATFTPVFITEFDAVARHGAVEVRWNVSSDEPVDRFEVYRYDGPEAPARLVASGPFDTSTRSVTDPTVKPASSYRYELVIVAADGDIFRSPMASVTTPSLATSLAQNYPNPFNPKTTIEYTLEVPAEVGIGIYDAGGSLVVRLDQGSREPGTHRAEWSGRDAHGKPVGSGVYFYRLEGVKGIAPRKMVLLK
ncbi:MAG TPA: FlgD immunoglobulin-like domain containing protein, partial [Candidatus Krumholzibacteria bacterium]|nr:FlgD immunoglobulin-like domain containing protein [Candidatus Krumholzibacteria bacterium]